MKISQRFEHFTHRCAKWIGTGRGFAVAVISIIIWFIFGEKYHFSYTWENALTIYVSILTFLMIFLMQRAQNKELSVLHIKLNELIVVTQQADSNLINAEELTEKEILEVHEMHRKTALQKS